MQIIKTISEFRAVRGALSGSVGFAPTMGYLHQGHMALMREAKAQNDHVIASIFVNPTQFGEGEDYESYPRNLERDAHMLEEVGVDILFAPDAREIYGPAERTFVEVAGLSDVLIGAIRPGHFRGVTTVVSKLFHIVQPHRAYFGEKDYQQLAILRQMVADLHFPIELTGVPIVREEDGLAMSSRNVRLSEEDRKAAVILSQSLQAARDKLGQGTMSDHELESFVRGFLAKSERAEVKAVDVRDALNLEEINGPIAGKVVVMLSVKFGDVFLIDNMVMAPNAGYAP